MFIRIVGSRWAFWLIAAAFAVSALLIALTAPPGLAYDEVYHFQVIGYFAQRWTPFVAREPSSMATAGDVTRYGSYLFHYLMSFPERILIATGASVRVQYEVLRVISIGIATASLYWFRRTILAAGTSAAVANTAMFVYAAIPFTSFVAATINYDNLLMLLAGIHLWLGVRAWRDPDRSLAFYAVFVSIGALNCLVVYQYLPMFAAATLAIAGRLAYARLKRAARWSPFPPAGGRAGGRVRTFASFGMLAVSLALFVERYGVNAWRYHSLNPDCGDIHPVSFCEQYAPWARNHALGVASLGSLPITLRTALGYFRMWLHNMLSSATFMGTGSKTVPGSHLCLLLVTMGALIAAVIIVITLGLLLRRSGYVFLLVAGGFYILSLFWFNYGEYRHYHQLVAVQGRYALLLIPLFLAAAGTGLAAIIRRFWGRWAVSGLAGVAVVLLLVSTQGGFFLGYFSQAQPEWFDRSAPLSFLFPHLAGLAVRIVQG